MACNHYHRRVLINGIWDVKKTPTLITGKERNFWHCPSCGAIRIDESTPVLHNDGKWSSPNKGYQFRYYPYYITRIKK